jgi:hypothetical protein
VIEAHDDDARQAEPEEAVSDLNVFVRDRPLPEAVVAARKAAAAEREANATIVEPRIASQLAAGRLAIESLVAPHTHVGDGTDLDLEGDTRQAAVWIVAGRCLGLANALLDLLEKGYAAEVIPTARTLHETNRLLDALVDEGDDALLIRWLKDEDADWVRPRETREARENMVARLRATMATALEEAEAASEDDRVRDLKAAIEEMDATPPELWKMSLSIYDVLSRIGHTRRSGTNDGVSIPLRQMITGPHPDPAIRGDYVEWSSALIEETMLAVGAALSRFFGPNYFKQGVEPILTAFKAVRAYHPLA